VYYKKMLKRKLCLLGAAVFAVSAGFAEEIFMFKLGTCDVATLVEARGTGNNSVLIGASEAMIQKYLPQDGYESETNAFVVKTKTGHITLIDTGFGRDLIENLQKMKIRPEDVNAVLLTHLHGDHIGGLQKDGKPLFPNADVYVSAREKESAGENALAALAAYGSRTRIFVPGGLDAGAEIFPHIKAVAAFGHTPGHTLYLVESEGQKLLIWGDLMHVQAVQFPHPEIAVRWDSDPDGAIQSRLKVLDYVSKRKIAVAGMHLVYPAVGIVTPAQTGYAFEPLR
jgi:glyoxylase-like metal-dependent hydrolase (beta-lactamase superfamily II)